MKKISSLIFTAILLMGAFSLSAKAPKPLRLTILCYNVKAGTSAPLEDYVKFVEKYKPDFVAFQELDYKTKRTKNQDFLGSLAEKVGMYPAYSATMSYSAGQYGVGLMSKYPFVNVRTIQLPRPEGSMEQRTAAAVVVDIPKFGKFGFVSVHLDHTTDAVRSEQAGMLNKCFAGEDYPVIIAGDFNSSPEEFAIKEVMRPWVRLCDDQFTFPNASPRTKIDYIYGSPTGKWKVVSYERIAENPLSDHCPIILTLEYTK